MRAPDPNDDEGLGGKLAAARRLDWRFLLPEPQLGRVVCIGRRTADLVAPLELFAEAVARLEPRDARAEPASFDLAVLGGASVRDCRHARTLLRPGGAVYVEVHRHVRGRRREPGVLRSAPATARVLERLGFVGVAASWHWPSFDAATHIVPLGDVEAVKYALTRRAAAGGATAKILLARVLLFSGLLPWTVPHASVIGLLPPVDA
jgi:hypothetical protein